MHVKVFELFAKVIRGLPPQGILKALEIECLMLKNDLENHHLPLPEDAFSIFYFREFVRAIALGHILHPVKPLPPDHIEFYKETIVRLVKANELPQAALDQFDYAFVRAAQ